MASLKTLSKINTASNIFSKVIKPALIILLVIFVLRKYKDIMEWFRLIFKFKSNYYNPNNDNNNDPNNSIKPDKTYLKNINDLLKKESNNRPFLPNAYKAYYNLNKQELRYCADNYFNPENPNQTLVDALLELTPNALERSKMSKHFNKAGIPFPEVGIF